MSGRPRKLVVIGGSAGSIGVLKGIVSDFESDLPATVLVVIHVLPYSESRLPQLLSGRAQLPVRHARSGEPLSPGMVLVAPPDYHVVIRGDSVELDHGPAENSARPAIDVLFRSAAEVADGSLCGVILSGALDDGAEGMRQVVAAGGVGIVQDPEDAQQPAMPESALALCGTCEVLPGSQIGAAVSRWVWGEKVTSTPRDAAAEAGEIVESTLGVWPETLQPTGITCPECHGVLWASLGADSTSFRCRVGHRFTFDTLRHQQRSQAERSLWAAVRALEEEATLCRQIADRAEGNGRLSLATRFNRREGDAMRHADVLRGLLNRSGEPPPVPDGRG
jgi:two-component system, chemotaxis family, protein-glutamate methylesterase/glutaminase